MSNDRKPKEKPKPDTVALQKLGATYLKPGDLKPNDYNPNRQSEHDFELLCKSIDEDGFTQPIVALRKTMTIVDGEHRWRAAMTLGLEEIPVVLTDMTEAQARVATLRHNRARGEEDVELAARLLKQLAGEGEEAVEYLQDSLNLDHTELTNFLDAVDDAEGFSQDEADAMVTASEDDLKRMVEEEGGEVPSDQTATVQDVIRAREAKLKATKDEQTRRQIERESDVYDLRLVFTGEEGAVVKRVLGDRPIARLIEICRERAAS
jgi:ParB/RepB/Spo0J family partition protein